MGSWSEARIFEEAGIDAAFRRAREVIQKDRISPGSFLEEYGASEIEKDEEYVQRMEKTFAEKDRQEPEKLEARKLGLIFEAIVHEEAELGNWLGENAVTIKPSKFDDIKNGVDELVEFQEGGGQASYLAMAIDVAISGDVTAKFQRIKREIDQGKLGEIKYFDSEHTGVRGKLSNVPRVVVGVGGETMNEIVSLWMSGDRKALNYHKIQFQVLQEIILQAETFRDYALRVGQKGVAAVYGGLAESVREVYEGKMRDGLKDDHERDSAFNAMKYSLKIFEA